MEPFPCPFYFKGESHIVECRAWPAFNWMAEGPAGFDYHDDFHFIVTDLDRVIGTIDGCPIKWDGNPDVLAAAGWDGMMNEFGSNPVDDGNWIMAIGTSILPEYTKLGLAESLLLKLKEHAIEKGYKGVLAPARPNNKIKMPFEAVQDYQHVRLSDGRHFDPWVRIHEKIGGKIVAVTEKSVEFTGSRADWEEWTKMRLPDNGKVIIPKAINTLNLKDGQGVLTESSIWIDHS